MAKIDWLRGRDLLHLGLATAMAVEPTNRELIGDVSALGFLIIFGAGLTSACLLRIMTATTNHLPDG